MSRDRLVLGKEDMQKEVDRMARELIRDGLKNVALVGIRTRGVPIAEKVAASIAAQAHQTVPVGVLDINLYRDDLSEVDEQPVVGKTDLPFDITEKGIILVDDVLYTGRTIRAAMDALIDYGRPKFIRLLAMIDRGWRELPIRPDYVGKTIETSLDENVKVMLGSIDGEEKVVVKKLS